MGVNKIFVFFVMFLFFSIPFSVSDVYSVTQDTEHKEATTGSLPEGTSDVPTSKTAYDSDGDRVCDKKRSELSEKELAEIQASTTCVVYDTGDMCIDEKSRTNTIRTGDEWIGCSRDVAERLVDYWSIKFGELSPTRVKVNWLTDQDYIYVYQPVTFTPNPVISTSEAANIEIDNIYFLCTGLGDYHTSLSEVININDNEKILKVTIRRFTEDELASENILSGKDNQPRIVKELEFGCRSYIQQHKLGYEQLPVREKDEFKFLIPIETLAIQPPDSALQFGVSASQAVIDTIDKIYPAVANARKIAGTLCGTSVVVVLTTKFFGVWIEAFDKFADWWWFGFKKLGGGKSSVSGGWIGGKAFCRYYACPIDWCPMLIDKEITQSVGVRDKSGTRVITLAEKMKEEGKTIQDSIVLSIGCQCISGIELNLMRIRIIMEQWNKCLNLALQNKQYVAQCEKYLSYHLCQYVVGEFGSKNGRGIISYYVTAFFKKIGLFKKETTKTDKQEQEDAKTEAYEVISVAKETLVDVNGEIQTYHRYVLKNEKGDELLPYSKTEDYKIGETVKLSKSEINKLGTATRRSSEFLKSLEEGIGGYAQGNIGYQSVGRTICEAAFYQRLPYGEVYDRFGLREGIRWETSVIGEFTSEVAYQVPVENTVYYNYKVYYNLIAGSENFRYRVYLKTTAGQTRDLPGAYGVLRSVGDYKTDYLEITDIQDYEYICFDLQNEVPRERCFPEGTFSQGNPLEVDINPWEQEDTEVDSDGDRLPDVWEDNYAGLGLKKNNKDSNGDGITDDKEDPDKDGFTNYREYQMGTPPDVAGVGYDGQYIVTDCRVNNKLNGNVISGQPVLDTTKFKSGESVVLDLGKLPSTTSENKVGEKDIQVVGEIFGPNAYYLQVSQDYNNLKSSGKILLWEIPSDAYTGVYRMKIQLAAPRELFGMESCTVAQGADRGKVSGFEKDIVVYNPNLNLCVDTDSTNSNEKGYCISSSGDVKVDSCSGTMLTEYRCSDDGKCISNEYPCPNKCSNGKCEGAISYTEQRLAEIRPIVSGILVAVDAGHGSGGEVGGSLAGTSGRYEESYIDEYQINWQIAEKLIKELGNNGVTAFRTRENEANVGFDVRINNIMKKYAKPADLVISIHGDAGTSTNEGVVTIYHKNIQKGKFNGDYGEQFAKSFTSFLNNRYKTVSVTVQGTPGYTRIGNPSILTGNSESNYPLAIIIETGFMNNPKEMDRLVNKQDELVKAIAASVVEYINSKQNIV